MDLERPAGRIFLLVAAVVLPSLIAIGLIVVYADEWVREVGVGTALLVVGLGSLGWAAVVALVGSRTLASDLHGVVAIAERGPEPGSDAEDAPAEGDLSAAQRRLKAALDERNRQIGVLASEVATAPLGGRPADVVAQVVGVTRQVTRDPTWQLIVLHGAEGDLLPPGAYDDDPETPPRPLGELEQWAAVADDPLTSRPRHLDGPWGAVVAVDASGGDTLKAMLLAPWAGRPEPTPAERDLLSLVAQIAGGAIEHALLYARLRAQTEELNRMAAVQSDFLRGVTHDLQTPLTSIRALASELGSNSELSEAARGDLRAMAQQSDRMRRMVGQLLAVSRLEAGALEPRQEIFRAEPIVERTWEALRDTSHAFAFTVEGEPHLVVGDADRFEQVLWALLDNAVKYSPAGSEVRVRLTGRPGENGSLVSELSVTDAGSGISAADRERAFDQFFRGERARHMVPDGSGIGLYAARGLVEAMQGRLELDPPSAGGATFRVMLPAEPTTPETEPAP